MKKLNSEEEWRILEANILELLKGYSTNTGKSILKNCIEQIDFNSVIK